MDLFKAVNEPRSILFGMKMNRPEITWLREKAAEKGLSKSSFVRKVLEDFARKEAEDVNKERG